ncbi:GNAT family N-acetyltransferase [uncultured Shimia sp.]|uniref:GNAT family N-acetyltransferase n=1 Tax=uncultured Shimia sp. TaxID=573152 RepID=UPI0025DDFAE7|nr:GNAT family N-acetyltransferase [uncultured Shimia sp.]
MTKDITAHTLYDVIDGTWPAAATYHSGCFTLRDGQGGGKRVCSATLNGELVVADIDTAEQGMVALNQQPIFQIREGDTDLDAALDARGYDIVDPVTMYVMPAKDLATERPPRTAAIPAWEPLQIMKEIWAEGGMDLARLKVMDRAPMPKTGFVSRWQDKPAGASFLGLHNGIGMVHALEILPFQRRQGVARFLMHRAAFWTLENGGTHLSVICTKANAAANRLYSSLGMTVVGEYHYRCKPTA